MITQIKKTFYHLFAHCWWVILFILICAMLYERELEKRNALYQQLIAESTLLWQQKEQALRQQEKLQLQINSQSDLAWIELTLMKGLGLVPEGEEKVYFYPDES